MLWAGGIDRNNSQCVALIDNVLQYQGLYKYNFSYVNAIDCLSRAASLGLKVTYFNGANRPPVGSVFVSGCQPYHNFGHIGFVVGYKADGTMNTIEQNVDGNADALTNGGWTRRVVRSLDNNGTFGYVSIRTASQQMKGWFELPFTDDAPAKPKEQGPNLLLLA